MMLNKFRLWYRPYKHYVHLLEVKFDSVKDPFSTSNGLPYQIKKIKFQYGFEKPEWGKIEDFIIEYWTGWKDKNGNDIYVNDVVLTPKNGQEYAMFSPSYGFRLNPVCFRTASFRMNEVKLSGRTMHDFCLEKEEGFEQLTNSHRVIDFLKLFTEGCRPKKIEFRKSEFKYDDTKQDYLCIEKNAYDEEIWLSDLFCDDFNWLLEEIIIL